MTGLIVGSERERCVARVARAGSERDLEPAIGGCHDVGDAADHVVAAGEEDGVVVRIGDLAAQVEKDRCVVRSLGAQGRDDGCLVVDDEHRDGRLGGEAVGVGDPIPNLGGVLPDGDDQRSARDPSRWVEGREGEIRAFAVGVGVVGQDVDHDFTIAPNRARCVVEGHGWHRSGFRLDDHEHRGCVGVPVAVGDLVAERDLGRLGDDRRGVDERVSSSIDTACGWFGVADECECVAVWVVIVGEDVEIGRGGHDDPIVVGRWSSVLAGNRSDADLDAADGSSTLGVDHDVGEAVGAGEVVGRCVADSAVDDLGHTVSRLRGDALDGDDVTVGVGVVGEHGDDDRAALHRSADVGTSNRRSVGFGR